MTTVQPIAQLGAEVLRLQARRVDDFASAKFLCLIEDLQCAMQEGSGVGIAAPQIGESWQVIIVASRANSRYPHAPEMAPVIMVNPEFHVTDASIDKDWEGCLSIPGIRALVPRHRAVQVSYRDRQGLPHLLELHGFPARVFQHEYDHLIGKVYLDRIETTLDIVSESEFFKRLPV